MCGWAKWMWKEKKGEAWTGRLSQSAGQPSGRLQSGRNPTGPLALFCGKSSQKQLWLMRLMHLTLLTLLTVCSRLPLVPRGLNSGQHLCNAPQKSSQHANLSAWLFNQHEWLQNKDSHTRMFSVSDYVSAWHSYLSTLAPCNCAAFCLLWFFFYDRNQNRLFLLHYIHNKMLLIFSFFLVSGKCCHWQKRSGWCDVIVDRTAQPCISISISLYIYEYL